MFGLFLLIPAPIAALRGYRRKKLFDAQADLGSIRALSWQEFEKLVAEAFHRMGYSVTEHGGSSPDGGIDLVATAPNEIVLVQCKHWRSQSVGVSIVREHYGVMTHEHATGGAIVVTGAFTLDAIAFAEGKPIQLIDGLKLGKLVLGVRREPTRIEPEFSEVLCPECDSSMVKRTAKKGQFAGATFWGCSRYPVCRGTRPMT
jgi:restriction system protein